MLFTHRLFFVIFLFFLGFYCKGDAQVVTLFENKIDVPVTTNYKTLTYIVKALSSPLKSEILFNKAESFTEPLIVPNRLILYGPSLDSQKLLVQELAKASDCACIIVNAHEISSETIEGLFEKAIYSAQESGRPAIIVIEGLDGLISKSRSEFNTEYAKIAWELRDHLRKHKRDPRLFLVCATNNYKSLDTKLLSNFPDGQIVMINKLNAKSRQEILTNLFREHEIKIDENVMNNLVEYSDGMDIADLESIVYNINLRIQFEGLVDQNQFIEVIKSKKIKLLKKEDPSFDNKIAAALMTLGVGYILYKQFVEGENETKKDKEEYCHRDIAWVIAG